MIEDRTLKASKFGRRYLILTKEANRLLEQYTPPPWPAVSIKEASKIIGYTTHNSLNSVIGRGYLDSIKVGHVRYVRKDQILWGVEQAKKHGFTKIPWHKCRERMKQDGR
jgi:hypothetical protein